MGVLLILSYKDQRERENRRKLKLEYLKEGLTHRTTATWRERKSIINSLIAEIYNMFCRGN